MVSGSFGIEKGRDGWSKTLHLIAKSRGPCATEQDITTLKLSAQCAIQNAQWGKGGHPLALEWRQWTERASRAICVK